LLNHFIALKLLNIEKVDNEFQYKAITLA